MNNRIGIKKHVMPLFFTCKLLTQCKPRLLMITNTIFTFNDYFALHTINTSFLQLNCFFITFYDMCILVVFLSFTQLKLNQSIKAYLLLVQGPFGPMVLDK